MEETKPATAYRCSSCGMESTIKQAFVEKKNPVGKKTRTICFECEVKRQTRLFLIELIGCSAFGILYYLMDPDGILAKFVLYVFASFLISIPILLLHELAHAIAGWLLGLRIFAIHLGFGRLLFNTRFLGVRWVVRWVPLGGATLLTGPETSLFRLRLFFSVLAGPASHVVLVALLYLLQAFFFLLTGYFNWVIELAIWLNWISLIANLIPRKVASSYGMTGTDGMKLLHIPRMDGKELEANHILYHSLSAVDAIERQNNAEALKLAQRGLERYPENLTLVNTLGYVYSHMHDHPKARETFVKILDSPQEIPETMKYIARNNIAFADIMLDDPALLQEADEYSAQAYQNMKWEPVLAGTRGAVLVAKGEYEEGIELLKVAFNKSLEKSGRATDACFLARAEHRRGNKTAALDYLNKARKLDSKCSLLKSVEQEINDVPSR